MGGMNTITEIQTITEWVESDAPNRLNPYSPLAEDVLDVDPFPPLFGWTLNNVHVRRVRPPRPTSASEIAYASLGV